MTDKVTVVTTGNFMLIDPFTRAEIEPDTETVVPNSRFIQDRVEIGHLRVIPEAAPAKKVLAK